LPGPAAVGREEERLVAASVEVVWLAWYDGERAQVAVGQAGRQAGCRVGSGDGVGGGAGVAFGRCVGAGGAAVGLAVTGVAPGSTGPGPDGPGTVAADGGPSAMQPATSSALRSTGMLRATSMSAYGMFLVYSTVTDFARFRGWSTSQPRRTAMW
jgi:hypothetical protein